MELLLPCFAALSCLERDFPREARSEGRPTDFLTDDGMGSGPGVGVFEERHFREVRGIVDLGLIRAGVRFAGDGTFTVAAG